MIYIKARLCYNCIFELSTFLLYQSEAFDTIDAEISIEHPEQLVSLSWAALVHYLSIDAATWWYN